MATIEHRLKGGDQLCFVHIMKTAGSTFTSILDAQFDVREICPNPQYVEVLYPEAADCTTPEARAEFLTRFRFVRGHFNYREICGLLKQPIYITILRNPIDRTLSFYEHIRRGARLRGENRPPIWSREPESYEVLCDAVSGSLMEFVCNPHPVVQGAISNHQTHYFASPGATTPQDLLETAKQNLDRFQFVGITERFNDSVMLLSYTFGWYPVLSYQRLKSSADKPKAEQLDADVLAAIQERNALDLQLYDHSKALFEARFAQMQQELSQKAPIGSSSELIPLLEQHYEQRYADRQLPRIQTLDFDFRQPVSGVGWQRRNGGFEGLNSLRSDASFFRWTGPGTTSTLDLPLATDQPLAIKLRVINAIATDVLDSLTLEVNGVSVPLKRVSKKNSAAVFRGVIPSQILKTDKPFTRLSLNVNRTEAKPEMGESGYEAILVGVALDRIQATPIGGEKSRRPAFLQDANWGETADFLNQHLQPNDRLIAPSEFATIFPQTFCASLEDASTAVSPTWVVLHKGAIDTLDNPFREWLTAHLHPVFANPVFIVFTDRNLPTLGANHPHTRAFFRPGRGRLVGLLDRLRF